MPNNLALDELNRFVSCLDNRLCNFNSGFAKFMQNEFCLVTEPSVAIAKRKKERYQINPNTNVREIVRRNYGDDLYRFSFRIKSEVVAHSREMHIFFDTEEDIRNYVTTSFNLLPKETGSFVVDREIQGVYAFRRTNRMVRVSDWSRNGHRQTVYLSATIDPGEYKLLAKKVSRIENWDYEGNWFGNPYFNDWCAEKMLCKFKYSYSYYIQDSNDTVYRVDAGVNPDDSFHITDG